MGASQSDKADTHAHVVAIAARRFREEGLARLSIADLMAEAGLTHGGFYKHFASRDALVSEAVAVALSSGSSTARSADQERAYPELVKSYLSELHRDNAGAGCAVCALMNDVSHAPDEARSSYTQKVRQNVASLDAALGASGQREKAILALAAMVGALGIARAVSDPSLSDEILEAVKAQLLQLTD
ncbi:TetR/AcrR family transcriptional regulator [Acerihabitans sp.]|uniref:TetR/AcrR family transcriptional regulator n=1 Tax=Acerihabitans sp. TaxID=2811394 RepID=UPI002EDBB833